jgi:hypothetical protein
MSIPGQIRPLISERKRHPPAVAHTAGEKSSANNPGSRLRCWCSHNIGDGIAYQYPDMSARCP